jgi:hypothetical protein
MIAARDFGRDEADGEQLAVGPEEFRDRDEEQHRWVKPGVEIAQHGGELRQHEQQEEDEHATGCEQHEGRIAQRVAELAAQRFGARAFGGEDFEDFAERTRGFAHAHQRDVHRREQRSMMRERLAEAFTRQDAGAHLGDDGAQAADVRVGGEQLQRIVEPRAGFQQQREVEGEDGDVLSLCTLAEREERRGDRGTILGDGVDRDEAEILDAARDFGRCGRSDFTGDDLTGLRQRLVAEVGHYDATC